MKKLVLASIFAALTAVSSFASAEAKDATVHEGEVEKKGVLATVECLKKGYFKDCRLETMATSPMGLFVHSEGIIYTLDMSDAPRHELDEDIGRNNVTVIGKLQSNNVIKVRASKAPPPEGKSFFKGCL
jgi:hypothetical protein